jgi:site-specific recombinase XerD
MSLTRLRCYKRTLFQFLSYCSETTIHTVQEINLAVILRYINAIGAKREAAIDISTLRSFMSYIFQQGHLAVDYSNKIPKYKSVQQSKLPSTYSQEEIQKLLLSVERSSAIGKRNYAIILIAARLGLRASDIAWLQFGNLHWDTCTLQIKQVKTGNELVLPLLPDVGNAIIDYLKYGRPESKEPYVFLKDMPPHGYFPTSHPVTQIVQRAFRKAGINIKNKKFGPHALRHTLGFRMLEESTILPVISEVLGHESTESTRYYLRIDLKSMRQCVLDVPAVTKEFYEQKGGVFYE